VTFGPTFGAFEYDMASGKFIRSKRPATLRAIERAFGEPLMDTEEIVDESTLDNDDLVKKLPD